jgi:hypothetical protein
VTSRSRVPSLSLLGRRRARAGVALCLLLACPGTAQAIEFSGRGVGHPAPAFPSPRALSAAARFLDARAGRTAFAVIDTHGQLHGVRQHLRFHSASLVKAMLLVAYLELLDREHRALDGGGRGLLYPMIHSSDNGAASAVFGIVGQSGLEHVAHQVGMTDFSTSGAWGFTQISAADQARFFYVQDRLIPHRFDGYARYLLSTIQADQSWGIPAGARPRNFHVFFKGGWLPNEGLVNQGARLERPGRTISLAVLTTAGPGMGYGEGTLQGVASRLVG